MPGLWSPSTHQDVVDKINGLGEIDSAERTTSFDLTNNNNVLTLVDGLRITIPPQTRAFQVEFDCYAFANGGTSASGTGQGVFVSLNDVTAGGPGSSYDLGSKSFFQPAVANQTQYEKIHMSKRFLPNTTTRSFQIYAKSLVANPTGWAFTNIYAAETPGFDIYSPMLLIARVL